MIPGEFFIDDGEIELNKGLEKTSITVKMKETDRFR